MEQPQTNQPIQQTQQNNKPSNTLGIISLVTGILGFFIFPIPFGIAALVTGLIEKPKSGLAVAGIVLGAVDIAAGLLILTYI
jgi:hypothetical protein